MCRLAPPPPQASGLASLGHRLESVHSCLCVQQTTSSKERAQSDSGVYTDEPSEMALGWWKAPVKKLQGLGTGVSHSLRQKKQVLFGKLWKRDTGWRTRA